jgi:hypothetical protein
MARRCLCGSSYLLLLVDLDLVETVVHGVDDNVHVVELRRDRLGIVVTLVLRPHDVHRVIAHMPFLVVRDWLKVHH